jgi:CubicO group peptidase (beta-lactamase class C family)
MSTVAMPQTADVKGYALPPFEPVADVFARCVARQQRGGAALGVFLDGHQVVSLAGGAFGLDSLVQVFSVSKAVVAVAAAHAAHHGRLDLDQPLGEYWDDFARPATATVTARMVLSHSAGIPAVDAQMTTADLLAGGLHSAVARQDPFWDPGHGHGYGAFTFGALMDGVFARAVGQNLNDYTAQFLTDPLDVEFWFGAPHNALPRLVRAEFDPPQLTPDEAAAYSSGVAIVDGSFAPIVPDATAFFNDPDVLRASWPSMSGVSSADALARLFAAVIGPVAGVRLLTADALTDMTRPRSEGWDRMMQKPTRFGSGVELPSVHCPLLGHGTFGHQGAAGSVIAADPAHGLAVAYTTNIGSPVLGASDHALVLLGAVRQCLESGSASTSSM